MGDMADWSLEQWDDFIDGDWGNTSNEPVVIPYFGYIRATEKAWFLEMEDRSLHWFPKSRCTLHIENKTITVPAWLAVLKGV